MPFVLFEFGFFTNSKELELLKSDEFRKASARVVVKSACEYAGITFKDYPTPVVAPVKWKMAGLKELYEVGLVSDFEGWSKKLDEPAPNWLVFHMVNELRKRG